MNSGPLTAWRPSGPSPASAADVIDAVLAFWFDRPNDAGVWPIRAEWFVADPDFDAAVANRFADACASALAGRLDLWAQQPRGALALVLLLDQFPRNIHRGTPGAFAGDERARIVAGAAIARRFDIGMPAVHRLFFYLPFEHSESMADQERACALIGDLGNAEWLAYAEGHRAIIARFGRFPHRNRSLGRQSTAEERAYLAASAAGY